jgi:hypothetical protein
METTMSNLKLTENEKKALQGIANSDFMDGDPVAYRPVWSWSANTFDNPRAFAGVVASLVKKGLAHSTGTGEDACLQLTAEGLAALSQQVQQ